MIQSHGSCSCTVFVIACCYTIVSIKVAPQQHKSARDNADRYYGQYRVWCYLVEVHGVKLEGNA